MNREEALARFKSEEADRILKEINRKMHSKLVEERDYFAKRLKEAFWNIMERAKDYPDFTVQEVQFSFLRTHIVDGTYQWLVELHDENGEFTKMDISELLEMKDIFGVYDECRAALYQEAAKYVHALTSADCDTIMQENFSDRIEYLYMLGIYAFRDIEEDSRFAELNIQKVFRVLIGERKDKAFVVYAKTAEEEDTQRMVEDLMNPTTQDSFADCKHVMKSYTGCFITDVEICFKNLNFSRFRNCRVEKAAIVGCKGIMADFSGSSIKDATLDGNCFNGADFSGSVLENVSIVGVRMDVLPYTDERMSCITMIPTSFRDAILKNVDFSGGFLAGCDFENAQLGRINFEGADMRGVRMDICYKGVLQLTQGQIKDINWIEK